MSFKPFKDSFRPDGLHSLATTSVQHIRRSPSGKNTHTHKKPRGSTCAQGCKRPCNRFSVFGWAAREHIFAMQVCIISPKGRSSHVYPGDAIASYLSEHNLEGLTAALGQVVFQGEVTKIGDSVDDVVVVQLNIDGAISALGSFQQRNRLCMQRHRSALPWLLQVLSWSPDPAANESQFDGLL